MAAFLAIVRKEFTLLFRDVHGLLLLFVMPTIFITIMSLAMQEDFATRSGASIQVLFHDDAQDESAQRLREIVGAHDAFTFVTNDGLSLDQSKGLVKNDEYPFLLHISSDFGQRFEVDADVKFGVDAAANIWVSPAANKQTEAILYAVVSEAIARIGLEHVMSKMQEVIPPGFVPQSAIDKLLSANNFLLVQHMYGEEGYFKAPSSVQQSVPAWLVFALFFVVVPLSNTFIQERHQGTVRRTKTINVSPSLFIAGKLVPYLLITQIQVLLMLAVGVYLVPVLGGVSLELGAQPLVLFFVGFGIAIAALGYAMLIAVLARTADQATTIGGAGNIVLAAIGGIMVPTFVMPPAMQQLAMLSPMNWGLSAFHDVLLRGGGIVEVLPEVALLFGFGCIGLIASAMLFYLKDGR